MRLISALITCLLLAVAAVPARAAEPNVAAAAGGEGEQFFETHVRPMLISRCVSCHGADKQEAGLRLDSRDFVLKGSESETVVVPGDPDRSLLIHAVRYDGDVQMPPAGKLDETQVALLSTWVKMGLPWGGNPSVTDDMAARTARAKATHWAYQPIVRGELPPISEPAAAANPIDHYVIAELEANGLTPSPPADRATLLRRASYDLTGLPPTADEVVAFVNDPAPDAYARAVDRLLASPAYGQRWGRYWLDIARYADTKGYVFTEEKRYPYAYTYRNYVIRALNEDRPYDEFLRQQIAADLLPDSDPRDLAALGFLTVGRRFGNNMQDIIDDRIDVVSRGLMGLTMSCARCHDHKYDPVPTDDYYAFYGIFDSCVEPAELPQIGTPVDAAAYEQFKTELAAREKKLADYNEEKYRELVVHLRARVKDYLSQVAQDVVRKMASDDQGASFKADDLRPRIVNRWSRFIQHRGEHPEPVFAVWHEFAALNQDDFAAGAAPIIERLRSGVDDPAKPINPFLRAALIKSPPTSMVEVAQVYGDVLTDIDRQWHELLNPPAPQPAAATPSEKNDEAAQPAAATEGAPAAGDAAEKETTQQPATTEQPATSTAPTAEPTASPAEPPAPPTRLTDDDAEQLRIVLYGEGTPTVITKDDAGLLLDIHSRNEATKLGRDISELKVSHPGAPPRAMVLNDAPNPHNARVLLRGDTGRPDREAPRHFVSFLSDSPPPNFTQGSGRLELARALTDPHNPLTARVAANRVWMHHFGAPLVRTPGDFGLRSEPPTHPALLDFLARQLIDEGWSLKRLHRLILLSGTYQQSSGDRPDARAIDPDNRLLWRAPRRRLDFEAMRDSMLAAAGRLDMTLDGRSVQIWHTPFSTRRSVYAYVDRQDLPGVFRTFDFASPDVSTPQRPETSVPQQALFEMNAPFATEQARQLVARPEIAAAADPPAKVRAMYRAALARDAEAEEVSLALRFIDAAAPPPAATAAAEAEGAPAEGNKPAQQKLAEGPPKLNPWEQLAQALLMTNEFMFVD